VVGIAVLAAAVVELVPPLVIRHVIDDNLTPRRTGGLAPAGLVYLAATAAVAVLTAGYGYLAATVAQRALAGLRGRLFAHLLALPTDYHDRTPIGDSISRATADIETIDDLFSSSAATLLGETARLLTVTAAMLVLSPILTAAGAVVIPPLALITSILRRRVRDAERATRVAVGALTTQLAEDLTGVEVIRAFDRQDSFNHRFRAALTGWLRAANRSVFYNAFLLRPRPGRAGRHRHRAAAVARRPQHGERQATSLQPAATPRPNPARVDQHPPPGAPTSVDDCDRIGDGPAVGHDLPELLQQVRTNEDRILSHRQHPISRCCDHRENPWFALRSHIGR